MKFNQISIITRMLALLVLMSFSIPTFAQEEPTKEKEEEVKKDTESEETTDDDDDDDDDDDGFDIHIGHDHHHPHFSNFRFSMLDIGISSLLYDGSFSVPSELDNFDLTYGKSININWHVFRHRLPIQKDKVGLEYGMTLSWMQYNFSNDFEILQGEDSFMTVPIDDDLKKNKLKTTFLEVPLMLTITPGKRKSYFISAGVYGGLLIGSKQKVKFDNGDKKKFKDDFNLNKVRYGLEGRVGLGPVSFYVQYSLSELFKEDQGPMLPNGEFANFTPINMGVTLLAW